ncbi:MAG: hypothetical protein M3680_10340 [Myxococcota bacterium]|nr:hypothetical protein [Myxococcota bacterium]
MRTCPLLLPLLLAAASGCYAAVPAEGVPCGAGGSCPSKQVCDPAIARCVFVLGADSGVVIDAAADASLDAAPPMDAPMALDFVDSFARPNGAAIGNGWVEKQPPTFSIDNGEVVRIATAVSYQDNLVYRPASEDVRDVEISIGFRVLQSPPRYPQIFVRARSAMIATAGSYDGYLLYVDGSTTDRVVLGRQLGTPFVTTLSAFTLSAPLAPGATYRLTLRAQGTSPVRLVATVELRTATGFSPLGGTTFDDAAASRIDTAGSIGFAGDEVAAYVYDDFRSRRL